MMSYEHWISYRYLTTSKGGFLSFLHFISIAGVAIGVMSLIVVTGVMTGFGNNLRQKIIGSTPHIMVEKEYGLKEVSALMDQLKGLDGVKAVAPYVQGNVFLEMPQGQAQGLVLRGIDPTLEEGVTDIRQFLVKGDLADLKMQSVIIGQELARYLGMTIGDSITLIAPGAGLSGQGWRYALTIVGIFHTGMVDYDTNLVMTHVRQGQILFDFPQDRVTGLGLRVERPDSVDEIKKWIYQEIGYSYLVKTWIDMNRNLFEALFLEKWGLFIVLTLMVLVASFNIISTLIVTVTSKIHDIGILQSIGVSRRSIQNIFMRQGMYIGFLGTFWGLVSGCGISYVLKYYVKVPQEIYSIDRVPVDIQAFDVGMIVLAALVISFLATIYPAVKAAALQPVEALRYE